MKTYIENKDSKLQIQLKTFCAQIDSVSTVLSLDTNKIDQIKIDEKNFGFLLEGALSYNNYAHGVVGLKNQFRREKNQNLIINIYQPPLWEVEVPLTMKPGMQDRFAELIQDCVNSPKFTSAIGEFLGIIKPQSQFVPAEGKPDPKSKLGSGGLPQISVTKGKYQGYSIYKDIGNGYKYYDKSYNSKWLDEHSDLPAYGETKTWKYKVIYIYKKKEVGSFSDEITITVHGEI